MENELKKHISELENLGVSKNAFNTPENYFKEFDDSLFTRISEEVIPKETGFKAPSNYFDQIEEDILKKAKSTSKGKVVRMKFIATVATIAAMFVIYFGVSNYLEEDKITFETLTENELNTWINSESFDIDNNTMAQIITIENTNELLRETEFSDIDLIEYLDNSKTEILFIEK